MFSNVVSCYDVELLATRPTNELEDTPCRMFATTPWVYYQKISYNANRGYVTLEALTTADVTLQLSW